MNRRTAGYRDLRTRKLAAGLALFMLVTDAALNVFMDSSNRVPLDKVGETMTLADSSPRSPLSTIQFISSKFTQTAPVKASRTETRTRLSEEDGQLCQIRKQSGVPLDGALRVQSVASVGGGRKYWLKSSNCPDELYSIVELDGNGRVEKEINCQTTNLTELTLNSGLQFNIENEDAESKTRSLAINGSGRFLVNCPDSGLTLTRDGKFNDDTGLLVNSEGCTAWTRRHGGRAILFSKEDTIDSQGCSLASGECLEILEPDSKDTLAFNFKTSKSLSVVEERGLLVSRDTTVFQDAYEDLDSPSRSLTGVEDWEALPVKRLPAKCE